MTVLKKARRFFVGLLFCLTVLPTLGGEFPRLYTVSVPLPAAFSSFESETFRKGLEEVLIRTTGNPDVFKNEAIQAQTKDIDKFIRTYWIENQNVLIEFDERHLFEVLRKTHQPILGPYRPVTLLWLVENSGITHQLITEDDTVLSVLAASLALKMESRGLPLTIPKNNRTENFLEPLDVWKISKEKLEKASKPYHYDLLLVVRVMKKGTNVLSSSWQTVSLNPVLKWQSQRLEVLPLAQEMADSLLRFLSRPLLFPTDKKQDNPVKIQITGIHTLQDFSEVHKKLLPFLSILTFNQMEIFSSGIGFRVTTSGDPSILKRNIALHPAFVLEETLPSDSLAYQWVPTCSKGC